MSALPEQVNHARALSVISHSRVTPLRSSSHQDHDQTGAAMVTMLDCHALPSQSSQVITTNRPAPV